MRFPNRKTSRDPPYPGSAIEHPMKIESSLSEKNRVQRETGERVPGIVKKAVLAENYSTGKFKRIPGLSRCLSSFKSGFKSMMSV